MSTSQTSHVSRKLEKVLAIRSDELKLLTAVQSLSSFYEKNSLQSRRTLRSNVERKGIQVNHKFLEVFGGVNEMLSNLSQDVDQLSNACDRIRTGLDDAYNATTDMMSQWEQLRAEKNQTEKRGMMAKAFLEKYQLSQSEQDILTGRDTKVDDRFFAALEKAQRVHADCRNLLSARHQRAGLETMDAMATLQDIAYERLFKYAQQSCRALDSDSTPDIPPTLAHAMKVLSKRSALFSTCIQEYRQARRSATVRGFFAALSRGGHGGIPKPIEMHAHDPLRFCGDMSAWIHQSLASENEMIKALLPDENSEGDILDSIFEGVCRPYRVRVEQVLLSELDPVSCYKLANLLEFYRCTFVPMIHNEEANLVETFVECRESAMKLFFKILYNIGNKLLSNPELPSANLSPPDTLLNALNTLSDLLAARSSMSAGNESSATSFEDIVAAVVDPVLQACAVAASGLAPADLAVHTLNCLSKIQDTLDKLDILSTKRAEMLEAQTASQEDMVVQEEVGRLMAQCQLVEIINAIHDDPDNIVLSMQAGADSNSMRHKVELFFNLMESGELSTEHCQKIQNSVVRDTSRRLVIERIQKEYGILYDAIFSGNSGYASPETIAPHSPQQVAQLMV